MVHRFDFLVSNGGNSVLSDNLKILSNTLMISLSVIVMKKISKILVSGGGVGITGLLCLTPELVALELL